MNVAIDYPKLHLGTAPDSWGVWMPSGDPLQTPWQRYLDEVQEAGYRYSELGPFGYLPTDPRGYFGKRKRIGFRCCYPFRWLPACCR